MTSLAIPALNLLGSQVAITSLEAMRSDVHRLAVEGAPAYICFATAHMIVLATREPEIRDAYKSAAIVSPDGTPVAWVLRLLGARQSHCVSGPRTMPVLLQMASERGIKVGFYGGRPGTLQLLNERIAREFPSLQVAYRYSPPFRTLSVEEQEADISNINASGAQILFVGLGSPRQESWMHRFSPQLNCVCLGVGGAFEFFSGEKHLPPFWIQSLGMTWLVRLLQEPRRLISRNLYSPVFAYLALRWMLMTERERSAWQPSFTAAREAAKVERAPRPSRLDSGTDPLSCAECPVE
jgi:N-acetylglucosaminyldiphosphoundecaprenol N-acetyl-beta-D-mannosaminyltransferase